jgi:4-hydroxy-tetrahydrodipicolinate synthase
MREPVFTGSCVAIVTPFCEDGAINFPKLSELIEMQIGAGTDAICICGTTGASLRRGYASTVPSSNTA